MSKRNQPNLDKMELRHCQSCSAEVPHTWHYYRTKSGSRRVQWRCVDCNRNNKKNSKLRKWANLYALTGCECWICGYSKTTDALDFHHLDPTEKSFAISRKKHAYALWRLIEEAIKCALLCSNCHRELHADLFCIWEPSLKNRHQRLKNALRSLRPS